MVQKDNSINVISPKKTEKEGNTPTSSKKIIE